MNSNSLVDDQVLMILLQKDKSKIVYQITLKKFQKPFIYFFKQNEQLTRKQGKELLQKSFDSFLQAIVQKPIKPSVDQTVFNALLKTGYQQLGKPSPKNQMKSTYFAGEILIQLMQRGHKRCLNQIFECYKDPTLALLDHKYGRFFNLLPQEIYGEAIMILKSNIEQGKVQTPLKSRLFTYFFLIARNKYLALANQMKGLAFYPDLIEIEGEVSPSDLESSFINHLEKQWPTLSPLLGNSKEETFKSLLSTFQESEQELLRLRFEEGLRFREIGKKLRLKEATCRKRLHDCLKKWKAQFFSGYLTENSIQLLESCS